MGRTLTRGNSIIDGEISLGDIAPGAYYVSLNWPKGKLTKKIILHN
jgi:hypothetical protein